LEPFCSDAEFGHDVHEIVKSFSGEKAFYYHMRYGNPVSGPVPEPGAPRRGTWSFSSRRTTTSCQTSWQRQQSRWAGTR
jgi:hypothetical protein